MLLTDQQSLHSNVHHITIANWHNLCQRFQHANRPASSEKPSLASYTERIVQVSISADYLLLYLATRDVATGTKMDIDRSWRLNI